ncbi:ArsR family transcriptional regulator [Rhizorhapis sp. SPR117]|uniref:ArsR family transcriptional regulator n=1 Tax=Rhizorhapis sp. SPR117 TaxID=2912611 RepID=UPI000B88F292|nr:ArsR family transcriptional regulator [Rhizorhapis sp. SPR117]
MVALAEPTRLAALAIVRDGQEHCVCELMDLFDISQSRIFASMGRHRRCRVRRACR